MTLEQIRELDAKGKSAFFAAQTDRHPQGVSGLRFLLPYENDRRMTNYDIEWANSAGFDIDWSRK